MKRPAGQRYSPNYYAVLADNWARLRGIDLGKKYHDGHCLFAEKEPKTLCVMYVVESRGPSGETGRPCTSTYPFHHRNRAGLREALCSAPDDLKFRRSENSSELRRLRMAEIRRHARAGAEGIK